MNIMRFYLLSCILILNSIWAFGYDFIYGPLAYDIVSVKDKTAMPVKLVEDVEVLEIPYTVLYEGIKFTIPKVNEISSPLWESYEQRVKEVIIEPGVVVLGDTFSYFSSLETVVLPSTIKELGATFKHCTSLKSFVIPKSVECITGALFEGCSSLSDVKFEGQPQFVNRASDLIFVTSGIFRDCTSLTSLTLPTDLQHIGDSWFKGCTNLKEVIISDNCISFGKECFAGCSSLSSLNFPSRLTSIGLWAFRGAGLMGNIVLPDEVRKIAEWAFGECRGIESFTFPNNCLLSVGPGCLVGCSNLKSITIPNNGAEFDDVLTDSPALEEIISLNIFPPSVKSNTTSFVPNKIFLNTRLKIREGAASYYSEDGVWGNFIHVEEAYENIPITNLTYKFIVPEMYQQLMDIMYPIQYFDVMEGNSLPIDVSYSSVGFDAYKDFKPYYNDALLFPNSVVEPIMDLSHDLKEDHKYCRKIFITPPINSPAIFSVVYESTGVEGIIYDGLDQNQPVEVYNLKGERVLIDFQHLSSGLYIIKQGTVVKKIVKP